VWVMGDNRTHSRDSRWMGPQPVSGVRGRAFVTYWPIQRMGALR
jgi:signal peptidase I